MEKITYHDKDYWYTIEDIIDWWDNNRPMIISCVSDDKRYIMYLNEYGDVERVQKNCK